MSTFRIVCPKCRVSSTVTLASSSINHLLTCPSCRKDFQTRLVTIRAKNSRGDKKGGSRSFSVRVVNDLGGQEVINFENGNYNDIELRSGDKAAFSYFQNELKVVQNLNVSQYLNIVRVRRCYVATYIYGSDSIEVECLRRFRDDTMLRYRLGRLLIAFYYKASPGLVRTFGDKRWFRSMCARGLAPVVRALAKRQSQSLDQPVRSLMIGQTPR